MCRMRCDQGDYTVKKALGWGICSSHFKSKGRSCFGRVVHFGFGLLLLPPVVGHIIALLELGIIKLFTKPLRKESLPDPVSRRPIFNLIKIQETQTDSIRYWPADLRLLALTEQEKSELDRHLKCALADPSFKWSKRRLLYGQSIDVKLPIGIMIQKISNAFHVWLFPSAKKSNFMSGGERTIGWAYNLTQGTFSLKKRIIGKHEERIIRALVQSRKQRGINGPQLLWRENKKKKKNQVLESILDGTPTILFGTAPFASISLKRKLILDFFSDLVTLHQMTFVRSVKKPTLLGLPSEIVKREYLGFHHDLTLSNLLVGKDKNGKWWGEICDFGAAAANPDSWCISVGNTPPEVIEFYNEHFPKGFYSIKGHKNCHALVEFNMQFGQKRDIWNMGLIILSILLEETKIAYVSTHKTVDIAPLECLRKSIKPVSRSYRYEELGILKLTQERLDGEITDLQKRVEAKHPADIPMVQKLFTAAKSMLRINPNDRPDVEALLKIL